METPPPEVDWNGEAGPIETAERDLINRRPCTYYAGDVVPTKPQKRDLPKRKREGRI
jgi:hypothetical protein